MADDQGYMTPKEAANFLRVNSDTIRRWCREGRLQAVRIDGRRGTWRVIRATVGSIKPPQTEQERKLAQWNSALETGYKR